MKKYTLLFSLVFSFLACDKPDDNTVTEDDKINKFIWLGLNAYYLWQSNVPDLADNRFDEFEQVYAYFRSYKDPNDVFQSLLNKPIDRFSWMVEDYVALENSFQGISLSNGMEFGLVYYKGSNTNIFGYVRYVLPSSDAQTKEVKRGMLFSSVNGTQLTEDNYGSLLFGSAIEYTIDLANYNDGNPVTNGKSISLTKKEIQENPVVTPKFFEEEGRKIGYLMYNQFSSSYDGVLNAAFGTLKAEGITDLIVDLRYNGGGSVRTATYLGGMISGISEGVFSKQVWNQKVQDEVEPSFFVNNFTNEILNKDANGNTILKEKINSLALKTVYFIVSKSSASASELVINALNAYIDVKLVGTTTYGKQVGSITLYDSDDLQKDGSNLNPNHTYAMQPIVLEIQNKDGENKPEGFTPNVEMPEDYGNLGVLGERTEPLLNRTIDYITGSDSDISASAKSSFQFKEITNSKLEGPMGNNMYVEFKSRNTIP